MVSASDVLVYQIIRSVLVMTSLLLYLCVSSGYQYRVRDWVVNVQWMVEDVIERRMEQEESYTRKHEAENRLFLEASSSTQNYGSFAQPS